MHDTARAFGVGENTFIRKAAAFGLLDRFCQQLELTETQEERAKSHYEAVGTWLSESDHPVLTCTKIYPQGSVAHGTTVKPIGSNEHDVDLIAFLTGATKFTPPAFVKQAIGDRLRSNGLYRDKVEEMPRCWRINYANEFHLDITPSIRNPDCPNGGELVPDKNLNDWKASNPKGFTGRFKERAAMLPVTWIAKDGTRVAASAEIEPFPTKSVAKGVLRRTVQLSKRHRDIYFQPRDASLAPLSIIITTLASRSYEYCIKTGTYENEFDLLLDTIRMMPHFIDKQVLQGMTHYFIWNETTTGENFAEKWNKEPARATAFYQWHARVLHDFSLLIEFEGMDAMSTELGTFLDKPTVHQAVNSLTNSVTQARAAGTLIAGAAGLTSATAAQGAVVRSNTFFGRKE